MRIPRQAHIRPARKVIAAPYEQGPGGAWYHEKIVATSTFKGSAPERATNRVAATANGGGQAGVPPFMETMAV